MYGLLTLNKRKKNQCIHGLITKGAHDVVEIYGPTYDS